MKAKKIKGSSVYLVKLNLKKVDHFIMEYSCPNCYTFFMGCDFNDDVIAFKCSNCDATLIIDRS